MPPSKAAVKQPDAIHEILTLWYGSNRRDGWRAKDLGVDRDRERGGSRKKSVSRLKKLLCQDVIELRGYLNDNPEVRHQNEWHRRKYSKRRRSSPILKHWSIWKSLGMLERTTSKEYWSDKVSRRGRNRIKHRMQYGSASWISFRQQRSNTPRRMST